MTSGNGVEESSGDADKFGISNSVNGLRSVYASDYFEFTNRVTLTMFANDLGILAFDIERT